MIVEMKKYAFLIYHKEYETFLTRLREIGVVHITEKAQGLTENPALGENLKKQERIKSALKILAPKIENNVQPPTKIEKPEEVLSLVETTQQQIDALIVDEQQLDKEKALLMPWGNFSWNTLAKLKSSGKYIHFFQCAKSKFDKNWETDFDLLTINQTGSLIHFIIVSNNALYPHLEADHMVLPQKSIQEITQEKAKLVEKREELNQFLTSTSREATTLLNTQLSILRGQFEWDKVKLQTKVAAEDRLSLLEGWVPINKEMDLVKFLDTEKYYFLSEKPKENENPPILLKNNPFAKLFELVGSLYSLPSYREIDLTPFFAPFFMLFFGFCLGDAGYGLLMMIATLILRAKAKPNMKPIWTLGFLFGVSTVIMGLIGGTVFGIMLVDLNFSWLESFKKIMLNQNQLMIFSIALGVIQIVFGMCLKVARTMKIKGLRYALSTIGWIIIILGVGGSFGLSSQKLISPEMGKFSMIGFGSIGAILALFFNSPGKNLFLNFGLGLWDAYGTVTGLLGDVLSYIRLFALGLSSAVLGSVFNQLAFELTGSTPVLSQLLTVLILLVGHSINFFMAALGSFVHPLRLTFVEFYKNTGFEGGGKKYQPFEQTENVKY
jgi:V/A-type H+/Na+-transporting ATPase subunit I